MTRIMNNRTKQNLLFLLLLMSQVGITKLISGEVGDKWLNDGYYIFMAINMFAVSFLVPAEWHFGRRLIRFVALQYFLFAVIYRFSGWDSTRTLQQVISAPGFYLFVLFPVLVIWFYKD